MLKKIMLIFIILYSNISFSYEKEYTNKIGEKVFDIAKSLSLSHDKILTICVHYNNNYNMDDRYNDPDIFLLNYESNCSKIDYTSNDYSCSDRIDSSNTLLCFAEYIYKIQYTDRSTIEWLKYIEKYPEIGKVLITIDKKFTDIFSRLDKLSSRRSSIKFEFSEFKNIKLDESLKKFDSDIRIVSAHGMELARVTKKLMETIEPIFTNSELELRTLSGRKEGMKGFASFEREINTINKSPDIAVDHSITKIIDLIDEAIDDFEKIKAQ